MSFADKIGSLMARPGQDVVQKDDVPWWMRYGGRSVGTIGGFIAIFLGVLNCVSIITADVSCLISGIWQIIAGFIAICVEAPCCCMFVDYVQNLSDWVEKRPYWNRAVAYIALALPAILLCPFSFSALFGSGLIFLTGVIYGMMALGKKASADEMRQAAVAETNPPTTTTNSKPNSMRSNLVENAQPISLTGVPIYDSNV